jgi:deoxyribodipyrimidine photo-lyase
LSEFGWATPPSDSRSAFPFAGGETQGKARVQAYFFRDRLLHTYKQTRNGLIGDAYSSKLSPWLATGSLSARWVYAQVRACEARLGSNESTYWLIFELLWREYFRYLALQQGARLFHPAGMRTEGPAPRWTGKNDAFVAWCEGQTGVPLVDANMRELAATGFMSNRGRQLVACYLTQDLKVDWRKGAAWFECMLVDYDVHSNWGNWAYVAGVGTDPREGRYFNQLKQARNYDPQGDYVRLWCPELAGLQGFAAHHPWTLSTKEALAYDLRKGVDYPHPFKSPPIQKHSTEGGLPTENPSVGR